MGFAAKHDSKTVWPRYALLTGLLKFLLKRLRNFREHARLVGVEALFARQRFGE